MGISESESQTRICHYKFELRLLDARAAQVRDGFGALFDFERKIRSVAELLLRDPDLDVIFIGGQ
jgi:hypothetical protein